MVDDHSNTQRPAHNRIDHSGQRFGRLLVLRPNGINAQGRLKWMCLCDCGRMVIRIGADLRSGDSASCGCLKWEQHITHGRTDSAEYRSWHNMLQRCLNPKASYYHRYGGRGVTVCSRWMTFANFYADMGPRPEGLSLERVDNARGYEPGNCMWASPSTQARNTVQTRLVEHNGERLCLIDWAKRLGVHYTTLAYRLKHWPKEAALTAPVGTRTRKPGPKPAAR